MQTGKTATWTAILLALLAGATSQAQPGAGPGAPKQILLRLDRTRVSFSLRDRSLTDMLSAIGKPAGVAIEVADQPEARRRCASKLSATLIELAARDALDSLVALAGLEWWIERGRVRIDLPRSVTRRVPVQDLLDRCAGPAAKRDAALQGLIEKFVAPGSWADPGGRVRIVKGMAEATATVAVQQELGRFLGRLRALPRTRLPVRLRLRGGPEFSTKLQEGRWSRIRGNRGAISLKADLRPYVTRDARATPTGEARVHCGCWIKAPARTLFLATSVSAREDRATSLAQVTIGTEGLFLSLHLGRRLGPKPSPGAPPPGEDRRAGARKRLEWTRCSVDLSSTPLAEALARLARTCRASIVLDPEVLRVLTPEQQQVDLRVQGLSVHQALKLILDLKRLAYSIDAHGVVIVRATGQGSSSSSITQVDDVRDLLAIVRWPHDPRDDEPVGDSALTALLLRHAGPRSWSVAGHGLTIWDGLLVSRNSPQVLSAVKQVLADLRTSKVVPLRLDLVRVTSRTASAPFPRPGIAADGLAAWLARERAQVSWSATLRGLVGHPVTFHLGSTRLLTTVSMTTEGVRCGLGGSSKAVGPLGRYLLFDRRAAGGEETRILLRVRRER